MATRSAAHLVRVELQAETDMVDASRAAPVPLPSLELAPPRRPGWPTLAALAITCGVLAVALGAWALVAETRSEETVTEDPSIEQSLAILTDSGAERLTLRGSVGRIALVVDERGQAVLTIDGLGAAPAGKVYATWVVPPGSAAPVTAGTFAGTERVVLLSRRVAHGARVGVTLEPVGGADRPSRPIRLSAVRG